ncbi:hypothetical protein MLD38_029724 [Melastoma candidum]|uniref:Uncharacterized protein n=1 Tax=Melastoma candidum TaxID=119954 RepID=A0ACB9N6Z1_9MYRT|nr:hypothetical protein MLD38_029724 [Melastoma candidum]
MRNAGSAGVCMMNEAWKNEQQPSFISFISSFLRDNSFRINSVPINPDLIFNCGGLSAAFVFVTAWDAHNASAVFSRIRKVSEEFAHLYVVVALRTKEHNDSFVRSYFKFEIQVGRPTFMPVLDPEMGFEKIVKIALALGACKQQDAIRKLKAERRQSIQRMDLFVGILTSIPSIDTHDTNSLHQALGSVEAIVRASQEAILEKTDLSPEKAHTIRRKNSAEL